VGERGEGTGKRAKGGRQLHYSTRAKDSWGRCLDTIAPDMVPTISRVKRGDGGGSGREEGERRFPCEESNVERPLLVFQKRGRNASQVNYKKKRPLHVRRGIESKKS